MISPFRHLLVVVLMVGCIAPVWAQHEVEHLYFTTSDGLKLYYAKLAPGALRYC